MTAKYFAILTNQGAARLANAAALGTTLNITQMAVGDANGVLPTPDPAQTALISQKRIAALNMLSIDPNNSSQIIAEQVIPENEGGYWIREIGLYDDSGVLVAVANCPETYKPLLQEGSGRTQTIRMVLIVSSTAAVTLKIDPAVVLATRQYVDNRVIEVKAYADSLLSQHIAASNPHTQYAPIASPTFTGTPKAPTAVQTANDTQLATTAFVKAAIAALVASSPAALDTLNELAAALGNDPNFATTMTNALSGKQPLDSTLTALSGKSVAALLEYLSLGGGLTGVVGNARNLAMSLATAGTTATWTADELITETALGGTQYKQNNLTLPIDLSVVGAGGVDVAGTVPTNGYLAIYAITGPGKTPAALGSNATTAAATEVYAGGAMPAGYTASALISVWRIVNGQFIACRQKGRRIKFLPFMVLASSIQAAAFTSLNLSACIPQNAKFISGYGNPNISGTGYNTNMALASTAEGIGAQVIGCGGAAIVSPFSDLEVAISQTIYYTLTSSTSLQTSYIYVSGYEF